MDTKMVAVPLFRDNNMAAMITLYIGLFDNRLLGAFC